MRDTTFVRLFYLILQRWFTLSTLVLLSGSLTAPILAVDVAWVPTGSVGWYAGAGSGGESTNWNGSNGMFIPSKNFNEVAVINNGGTAFVNVVATGANNLPFPGGLFLGQGGAQSGNVEIRMGGSLSVEACSNTAVCNGGITVGGSGTGMLLVEPGGTLNGQSLTVGGNTASKLTLGAATAGTTTLGIAGNATLNRTTQIIGPNVNFSAGGNVTLGPTSTLIAGITSATSHSPIKSLTSAMVAGNLQVDFASGLTPSTSAAWNLIDSPSIAGNFSSVTLNNAPVLNAGTSYRVKQVAGGLGSLLQLEVAQLLNLRVNWDDKTVRLQNSGSGPIAIDGYSILSNQGALNNSPAAWNSISESDANWDEAFTSPNAMSELRKSGSSSLAGGYNKNLGSIFSPVFPAFGVNPEDVTFEYREADGTITHGSVVYEGTSITNNLRLTVDPTTGAAQLKNDSPFTVAIDGYSILSDSGALLTGNWNQLGQPGWQSAAPTSMALSELLPTPGAFLTLQPGTAFGMGNIFNTSGQRDLALEFRTSTGPLDGVVTYGQIQVGLPGDFDNDGDVDGRDFLVWQRGGTSPPLGSAALTAWQNNYGSGSLVGAIAAVPEPASLAILLPAMLVIAQRRRQLA